MTYIHILSYKIVITNMEISIFFKFSHIIAIDSKLRGFTIDVQFRFFWKSLQILLHYHQIILNQQKFHINSWSGGAWLIFNLQLKNSWNMAISLNSHKKSTIKNCRNNFGLIIVNGNADYEISMPLLIGDVHFSKYFTATFIEAANSTILMPSSQLRSIGLFWMRKKFTCLWDSGWSTWSHLLCTDCKYSY